MTVSWVGGLAVWVGGSALLSETKATARNKRREGICPKRGILNGSVRFAFVSENLFKQRGQYKMAKQSCVYEQGPDSVITSETRLDRVDSEAGSLATSSYTAEDLAQTGWRRNG